MDEPEGAARLQGRGHSLEQIDASAPECPVSPVEVKKQIVGTAEPAGTALVAGREKQLVDVSIEVRPVVVAREALEGGGARRV
ncbi:MAG TPA: hypothetical protein VKB23_06215 [Solirubrobacterales bacterium]|nr:hypothetical protein [Solirubrobacterales bacterium]